MSGIKAGDIVELHVVKDANYYAEVRNFKMLGSFSEPIATPSFS